MTTATQFINVARSQVGYTERANNNNKYGIWYGMNNAPYCAIGLTWCAAQLNNLAMIGGKWAYCPFWANYFRAQKHYSATPTRGAIGFCDWSGRKRVGQEQHVTIVTGVRGSYISTIEFNTGPGSGGSQSNGDGVHARSRHISLFVGFGMPKYTSETSVKPLPVIVRPSDWIPLSVDGAWGPATTRRLQQVLRVPQTGKLDAVTFLALGPWLGQPATSTWTLTLRKALQSRVGAVNDGSIGPLTVMALQRYLNRV